MPKMKIDDVVIGTRARKELGEDFDQLRGSIKERGLINAICIHKNDRTLIAGYRRLCACKQLQHKTIDVKFYEDLSTEELLILELEENIHAQLTWDEQRELRVKVHQVMQDKHGKATRGHESSGWGIKETAKLMGVSEAIVSQDMAITAAVEILPDIRKLTSRRQALKAVDRTKEIAILTELARRQSEEQTKESGAPYVIHHGDAIQIVKDTIEDEVIDLVIFDPPWGIDVHRRASSRGPRGEKTSYDDDSEYTAIQLTLGLLPELWRVMKSDAHLYMFVGSQYINFYKDILNNFYATIEMLDIFKTWFGVKSYPIIDELAAVSAKWPWAFYVEEVPLIWIKESGGYTDFDFKFMPRYESILFCSKGEPKKLNEAISNVFEYSRPATTERIHTQEKPIDLIQKFIKLSTQPNQIVLDPCAGSFVTTVAATLSGRRSIAIDNSEECYLRGKQRIESLFIGGLYEDSEEDNSDDD